MKFVKHLTVVSPQGLSYADDSAEIRTIAVLEDVEIEEITSITELYSKLSDCRFSTRVIGIDLESLHADPNVNAWDVINTIATLIKSTRCRCKNSLSETEPRKTFIVAGVTVNTDIKLIREFLNSNELCIGVFPRGSEFTYDEKRTAMLSFQAGKNHIPKLIQDRLKPKKKSKLDPFKLTPRQQQIFDLILERGISNKVIARTLNISESTVKLHMTTILKKCGVRNRTQLAVFSKHPPSN